MNAEAGGDPGTSGEAGGEPTTLDESPEWMGSLPEDIKGDSSLSKFKDVGGLAKSYKELETKMGSSVNIPGDGASDEEVGSFYNKLGRPESAGSYVVDLPEGISPDDVREAEFRPVFHSIGLTQKQVTALVDADSKHIQKMNDDFRVRCELNETELKREWGDEFENNMAEVDNTVKALGDEEVVKIYGDKNILYNKSITKLIFEVSKNLGEDQLVRGEASKGEGAIEAAKNRRDEIYADNKWLNGTPAEKKVLSDELRRVSLTIHGSEKVMEHGRPLNG